MDITERPNWICVLREEGVGNASESSSLGCVVHNTGRGKQVWRMVVGRRESEVSREHLVWEELPRIDNRQVCCE